MSPRVYLSLIGGTIALIGFVFLVVPATENEVLGIYPHDCGTVLSPSSVNGEKCRDTLDSRATIGWPLLGIGAVVGLGALALRTQPQQATGNPAPPAPTEPPQD